MTAPGPAYLLCIACRRAWNAAAGDLAACDRCGDLPIACRPGSVDSQVWYRVRVAAPGRQAAIAEVRARSWVEMVEAFTRAPRPAVLNRRGLVVYLAPVVLP